MSFWRKALRGAVRGAGRTTGRALSRYVLPDSVIPSWKTQQRTSKATSTIWRFGSRLVKKAVRNTTRNIQRPPSGLFRLPPTRTVARRPASVLSNAPRSASRPSMPVPGRKTSIRQYVDTDTGEVYTDPGLGRVRTDMPPLRKINAWSTGAVFRPPVEFIKMNSSRAQLMSGPVSIRKPSKRSNLGSSYNGLTDRPSKYAY